jgi:hypothetical protein
MPRNILLSTTRTPANRAAPRLAFVRFFRLNPWLAFLIGFPVIIAITLLAIFFFAASLGLFAVILAIAAPRVWWLRRQTGPSDSAATVATTQQLPNSKRKF